MAGATAELPDALPRTWIARAEGRLGGSVPGTLSEPGLPRGDADDMVDEVIAAVLRADDNRPAPDV
jgi:hypothetical protein